MNVLNVIQYAKHCTVSNDEVEKKIKTNHIDGSDLGSLLFNFILVMYSKSINIP